MMKKQEKSNQNLVSMTISVDSTHWDLYFSDFVLNYNVNFISLVLQHNCESIGVMIL